MPGYSRMANLEPDAGMPGYSQMDEAMLHARAAPTGEADSFIPRCIVHRLDRGTSGVLLVAKTAAAESHLVHHFSRGSSR